MAKDKKQERILRIGIVQGGRIIEERLLRHKEAITIGQSPKNKFMIPSPRVPISYTLVDVKAGRYVLCFEKGMLGKILVEDEILDLKTIAKRRLATRKDARFSFPLGESSRGKIVLGDVTLLFQFVTPPPEVPRLQLPAEAKGAWWRNIDRALLATFMLALIALGGSGGGLDAWWRHTGRYLAPGKRAKPKIFQTLVTAAKQKAEKKEKKSGEGEKKDEKAIVETKDDADKADDKSKMEELGIGEGENTEVDLGDESDFSETDFDTDAAADKIDMDDVGARLKESFKEPDVKGPSNVMSADERMARAKRLVSDRTVVGVMGSQWGVGDGTVGGDSLAGGVRRIKDGSAFGSGVLESGEMGGLGSDYLSEEDGLGGIAEQMGPAGMGGMPGELGGGPGGLIKMRPDMGPEKGPGSVEVIKGPREKLKSKRPKAVEKRWKLSLSSGRSFVGGKIDKKAVNKYLRARSSAFQRCFTMVARRNPNVGGKLTLRIKIDLSGRATARVVSDKTGDSSLSRCIIGKVKQWSFPRPAKKSVEFVIPFVFRAL